MAYHHVGSILPVEHLKTAVVKKGPIEIGAAVETAGGKLPAKYVINAATMGMDFETDEIKIRNSCRNSLIVAEKLMIKSVAFPVLVAG